MPTLKTNTAQELYYAALAAAPLGFFQIDAEGTLLEVNEIYVRMSGYAREELLGRPVAELGLFVDTASVDKVLMERKNSFVERFDTRQRRKDGSLYDVEVSVCGTQSKDGGAVLFLRDLAQGRAQDNQYRQLFNFSSDAQLLLTFDTGQVLEVNEMASTLYGYTPQELREMKASQLSAEPVETIRRIHEAQETLEVIRIPVRLHRRKDGHVFPVEITARTVIWNDREALLVSIRDVSLRQKMERYAEITQEILQILNESSDVNSSIRSVISVLKERTGVDAVGIRLQHGEDFPYFAEDGFDSEFIIKENSLLVSSPEGRGVCRNSDGSACLECTCGLVISGKTDPSNPLFTRGGSCFTNNSFPLLALPGNQDPRFNPRNNCIHRGYASVALIPIHDKVKIVGLIHLVDQRKDCFTLEMIERLEGISAHIGTALMRKQAEADLAAVHERLRQSEKMEAIGQLAGGIAHDFNNQLGGILGFAELLEERLEDPKFKSYTRHIQTAATRSAELTRQLLAFSRKGNYLAIPVDLHAVIAEVIALISHGMDKRIEIRQQLDAAPATVTGDPAQLSNTLLNLAINAGDAMPGGGTLLFATSVVMLPSDSSGSGLNQGRYLQVAVRDTGTGIDEETMKHIFEPFFTTKELGKGTGLGLAAVHGAVTSHKGLIRVESRVGEGTTFFITLPLLEERPAGTGRPDTLKAVPGVSRILLVDDENVIREVAREILSGLGYSVVTCEDGEEAAAYYRQHWREIDLVILDMMMPRMNGRESFLAMRSINPGVRVILSSGFSLSQDARQILEEGVLSFIQKPFTTVKLSEAVAEALVASSWK